MIQLSENTTLGATSQVVGEQEKMMLKKLQEELFPALKKEILKEEIQRQGAAKLEIMESVPKQIYQHVKAEEEDAVKLVRWFLASSKQPVPALASFVRLGGLGAVPRDMREAGLRRVVEVVVATCLGQVSAFNL
eukprot:s10617_g2.t1